MKLVSCFILFVLFVSFDTNEARRSKNKNKCEGDGKGDYKLCTSVIQSVLALSWPTTFCEEHTCNKRDDVRTWTIHGLWPSNSTNNGPFECRKLKLENEEVEPLKEDLEKYWPKLKVNFDFWSYEWNKHGTCALGLPNVQSERDFFSLTLKLFKSINLDDILAEHGIKPDNHNTYTTQDFVDAIKDKLEVEPILKCNDQNNIEEIRFCYNNQLKLKNCKDDKEKRCPTEGIIYPVVDLD